MESKTRETIKKELTEATQEHKHFTTTTAFYWLNGSFPGMTLAEAVEIVDEMRQETPEVFADY